MLRPNHPDAFYYFDINFKFRTFQNKTILLCS